ncbi:alpha-xenorhabdolysin family binary toxin subunit B [Pseudomonas aegrilactucae]|uniref:Alpha-xenorhabdolysin family binary toxin subunit B n=1 Tax=Pseudomonas aegrilactucae TaxID=2854028 RepID=A0A9Q2XHM2_9PSED|nr:alpha-xenorhabdolysin family binary toxin subunit B [Pseudomonas aegrilactucae]MBV6286256.1 alpha-xenorhabdolysin family binary toxin subunit B [Pseudomonas aegrilactucae]
MSNLLQFPLGWDDPQFDRVLRAGTAYLAAYQDSRYAFLPLLHERVERHARCFDDNLKQLMRHVDRIIVAIKSNDLSELVQEIDPNDDPEDIAQYLEVAQDAVGEIAAKLNDQLGQLGTALVQITAIPPYDPSVETTRYQRELDKLAADRQGCERELAARGEALAGLDEAIKVLEAAKVESTFSGLLPTTGQLKAAADMIAAGGVSVEAVQSALKRIGEIIGAAMEGMRYAALLEQRRGLQKNHDELQVQLTAMARDRTRIETQRQHLEAYADLITSREEWQAGIKRIAVQLKPVWDRLAASSIDDVQALKKVNELIYALKAYKKKMKADYTAGL